MRTITGTLEEVSNKDWHGTKLWKIKVDGVYYNMGTKEPPQIVPGSYAIRFNEANGKVVSDIQIMDAPVVQDKPAAGPAFADKPSRAHTFKPLYGGTSGTPLRVPSVNERIQWQNARADACRVICAALELEGRADVKGVLPWASNLAKKKKFDLLKSYINELTREFIEEEENEAIPDRAGSG